MRKLGSVLEVPRFDIYWRVERGGILTKRAATIKKKTNQNC